LFGSFLPSLLVGQHHQLYSATGADIVMESISLSDHSVEIVPVSPPEAGFGRVGAATPGLTPGSQRFHPAFGGVHVI
jgi:hypothetical protein